MDPIFMIKSYWRHIIPDHEHDCGWSFKDFFIVFFSVSINAFSFNINMLFIAQLEVLLWYCINCESSIFIMLLITTSKNVCVEVYEYRACFGKTRPCLLDDSRRFLTCIWLLDTEIIIFFVRFNEVRLVIKYKVHFPLLYQNGRPFEIRLF